MAIDWQKQQKEFIAEQFAKLTARFLTENEQKLVSLDFGLVDWTKMSPTKCGLTRYNIKSGTLKASLRYHTDYEELLDTIAHEFAHVYLNLYESIYHSCEELKHNLYTAYFLRYLKRSQK
jgi:hypothetical protein